MLRITMAQINTTPNDFAGNYKKIFDGIAEAEDKKADVVVFPELTLPGYLVKDLVYTTGFIEKNLSYLQQVVKVTTGMNVTAIIGYVDNNHTGVGKPFRNMAAVIHNGAIIATYQKHLLPFYDVFDEGRYFEPGHDICVFKLKGHLCGIVICEDAWNDKGQDDYCYEDNPVAKYRKIGVNYLFSLNSSPYALGKPNHRINMLRKITDEWNGPVNLVYVNQIGGQDELVFDGHSCIISEGNVGVYLKNSFAPKENGDQYVTTDVGKDGIPAPYINYEFEYDNLKMVIMGLHDYIIKSGFKKVVLGSSGGVDSALVAALATLAIGGENVNCIMMPSIYSSEGSVKDAKDLHKRLGCNEFLVPIDNIPFENYLNDKFGFKTLPYIEKNGDYNKVADENLQARMRGQIVMHYSNATGALALTTGNKTELATGYCTLYGDMNGGFNPIGDLYKMQVFDMCRMINKLFGDLIPKQIINKPPSAELRPDQTDEASLLPYVVLDEIVKLYIEQYVTSYGEYVEKYSGANGKPVAPKDYDRITRLIYINEFKRRQAAPTIKLSKVAFGTGRRLPIVKK